MKIGTVFDIEVYINKMLIVLVAIAVLMNEGTEIAAIFFALFLHEAGHVLVARLLQLKVREIEILPFGGAVRIESLFELNPRNEIMIALAGPLVNILVVLGYTSMEKLGFEISANGIYFIQLNLMLAGFNMLPALPLDGGRVFRAILSREIGMKKATQVAASGGLVLALFLLMTGIFALYYRTFNVTLFLMAGFLSYSALKEKRVATYIFLRDITYKKDTLLKEGSMPIRELVVMYDIPIKDVMKKFTPHRYHMVSVVDHKMREMGTVSENDIIKGLLDYGINVPINRLVKR